MDEKELRKFNYEFIKENNPDLNFVQCTDALINWVSNIPNKNKDMARLYLTKLTDRLEANYLNSTLETTYSTLNPNKRSLLEFLEIDHVEQERYFAKSTQFKGRHPIEPVSRSTSKSIASSSTMDTSSSREPMRVEGGKYRKQQSTTIQKPTTVNYFCDSYSEKAKSKNINTMFQSIASDPAGWEKKFNDKYELVFHGEGIIEEYLSKNITLEKLYTIYKKLEPSKFLSEKDEKFKLAAKMKQSLVALVLYLRLKGDSKDDKKDLVFGHLRRLVSHPTSSNPLWRHCRHVYIFYEQLGDTVILMPEIFDKIFFLQYPPSSMQTLIDLLKRDIHPYFTTTKRFSTILNENLEK
ncbi:hypothetical protein EDC94DRAFT_589186 [Helicostylum pulchrum]|nr:hypothetical protein EDC94DRAFT_589186 [Helicostylum pulchrum]